MPRNLLLCALLGSLLLLTAPFAVVSAEDDVDEKDVVVLTDKNFDKTIKGAKFALVSPPGAAAAHLRCRGSLWERMRGGEAAGRRRLPAITRPLS